MNADDLLELADSPDLISGIYNYCDRWCERCPQTHRCMLFMTMRMEDEEDPDSTNPDNEAFWKRIQNSFAMTLQLLKKFADKEGINLDFSAEENDEFSRIREAQKAARKKLPVIQHAQQYIDLGKQWLDGCREFLVAKDQELNQELQLDLPGKNPQQEAESIRDAIDIISYHLFQIFVKMMRAYSGKDDDAIFDDDGIEFPKDSDGSAKVALIGIDRSIHAWATLLNTLHDQEETILEILSVLQRLVHLVEEEFPAARSFIRPGFDD